jgi:hypothetical protein
MCKMKIVCITYLDCVGSIPAIPTHETCLLCSAVSGLMKLDCLHNILINELHENLDFTFTVGGGGGGGAPPPNVAQ